jgi:hypothetical protein
MNLAPIVLALALALPLTSTSTPHCAHSTATTTLVVALHNAACGWGAVGVWEGGRAEKQRCY